MMCRYNGFTLRAGDITYFFKLNLFKITFCKSRKHMIFKTTYTCVSVFNYMSYICLFTVNCRENHDFQPFLAKIQAN